jgi:hypothetical protein
MADFSRSELEIALAGPQGSGTDEPPPAGLHSSLERTFDRMSSQAARQVPHLRAQWSIQQAQNFREEPNTDLSKHLAAPTKAPTEGTHQQPH